MSSLTPIHLESRAARRDWLAKHHATEKNVWLKLYRKASGTSSVSYDEAVDEALCFGWIDSAVRKGDEEHRVQFFSQRKPKSNWSRINKAKIEKLTMAGLMTDAGQKMVDLAKRTGTWTALDEIESLTTPPDLQTALDANPTARTHFEAFPRSPKRAILEWLLNAKTPETRVKRIAEVVAKAERNERANQYVRKF